MPRAGLVAHKIYDSYDHRAEAFTVIYIYIYTTVSGGTRTLYTQSHSKSGFIALTRQQHAGAQLAPPRAANLGPDRVGPRHSGRLRGKLYSKIGSLHRDGIGVSLAVR